jgi:hypothetical protein
LVEEFPQSHQRLVGSCIGQFRSLAQVTFVTECHVYHHLSPENLSVRLVEGHEYIGMQDMNVGLYDVGELSKEQRQPGFGQIPWYNWIM